MMAFNDDEPIVGGGQDGSDPKPIKTGKVTLTLVNKDKAPLEKNDFQVLVKLTATADASDRAPLDLVAVLDISGSMAQQQKLDKLKIAMRFVIKKLGPRDRLSIVTFSEEAEKKCALRQMTGKAPAEIEKLVNDLEADKATNILRGLEVGKQVLEGRKNKDGRYSAIILLSDGEDNVNKNKRVNGLLPVPKTDVPIYTFGFGKEQESTLLNDIAVNSGGGTFATVEDGEPLTQHFSQCLGLLVTTVVQDLALTLAPIENNSEIIDVQLGSYPSSKDPAGDPVTFQLGTLSSNETRTALVTLRLPKTRKGNSNILEIKYSHRDETVNPTFVNILRTKIRSVTPDKDDILREKDRLEIVKLVKDAANRAVARDYKGAQDIIDRALKLLQDAVYERDESFDMLKYELEKIKGFVAQEQVYKNVGSHYILSFLTSHDLQRFGSRGDLSKVRTFATPRMNDYFKQATEFNQNTSVPLPTEKEDVQKELDADPFAPIIGALNNFNQAAFGSLKQNESMLDQVKTARDLATLLDNADKALESLQKLQSAATQFLIGNLRSKIKSP